MTDLMRDFTPRKRPYFEQEDCIGYFCHECEKRVATTAMNEPELDLKLFKPCKCGCIEYMAMLTKRKKQ